MRCSGFEELLVESGVCSSGSIEKVMTGKYYNRPLCIHELVFEALDCLLLYVFMSTHGNPLEETGGILIHGSQGK